MSCTYIYKGKSYKAWEFDDVLASMPLDELAKYLPQEAQGALIRAARNEKPMFSFAGKLSYNADQHALATAQDRLSAGEDAETIRRDTGWFRGVDGKWRYEISDSDAVLKKPYPENGAKWGDVWKAQLLDGGSTVGKMIDHPALFAAYPSIADIPVSSKKGIGASYHAESRQIEIGEDVPMYEALSTLLHEIQHDIQTVEGFASGGSIGSARELADKWNESRQSELDAASNKWSRISTVKDYLRLFKQKEIIEMGYSKDEILAAKKMTNKEIYENRVFDEQAVRSKYGTSKFTSDPRYDYERLAGEVEARNTQARINMTDAERIATPPNQTADFADSRVIVVFNGTEMANAPVPANIEVNPGGVPELVISGQIPDTINVDGLDRPTRNSNGKLIHPTEDGVRNFWRWFGGSRVVDEQGRPRVVYHGTGADFNVFSDGRNRSQLNDKYQGDGFHFSADPKIASRYAWADRNMQLRKEDIYPLVDKKFPDQIAKLFRDVVEHGYEKAWDIPDNQIRSLIKQADDVGVDLNDLLDLAEVVEGSRYHAGRKSELDAGAVFAAMFGGSSNNLLTDYHVNDMVEMGLDDAAPKQNVMPVYLRSENPLFTDDRKKARGAKRNGYDGLYYSGPDLVGGEPEWVVFSSTQIKSATGNNGDFDGSNPSIQASVSFNLSDYAEGFKPTTISEWVKAQFTQKRPFMLGFLTLDQIADIYGKTMKSVKKFAGIVQAMDTEKQKISDEADKVVDRWRKLDSKEADKLADVMHAATLAQFDPATFDAEVDSKDSTKVDLRNQFLELSPEAQKLYVDARDSYRNTMLQVRDALAGRIERSGLTGGRIATEIRLEFDKYLSEGPYFPLARFGDFVLISNNPTTGERIVESFESVAQRNKMKAKRIADGFKTKETSSQTYSATKDGAAGKFAGDVLKHIQATEMDEEAKAALMDNLNQLAISSLPDQSYRKHFMHRKGTPGFSKDAMRAFANSQFHAAHHIAKINHADQLSFLIDEINNDAKMATEGDVTEAVQIANELKKRLDDIVNPKTGPVAANLGSLGFLMSLGGNIASGVTNLSQTPLVTYPWLGAKFGFDKAAAAMSKASKDYFGGKWNAQSGYVLRDNPNLTKGEREALDVLQDMGKIDLTQAHDLAGVANQNNAQSRFSMARSRAMKIVGWTFHLPEVFNRQTSALAAYRLAIEGGMNHKQAIAYAAETLDRTHFNYSSSNRARFMQGDFMRVLTMFKQYSQQMTYMLWRNAYQALKGESPEVRREARRLLMGILTMHFMAAGSMGLPLGAFGISTILLPIASAFMGDEDDPWEWEVEYRNMLADTFGTKGGEVIAHGALRALMPWADFAGRVGLGDLWFRPPAREMEGRAELDAWLQTLAGPVYGYLGSWVTGTKLISEGNVMRGVETMMPRALAGPLKSIRYGNDGVQSMKGDDLGIELGFGDYAATFAGFNPSDVSEMYESRNAVKNREHLLDLRRTQLINKWYNARKAGDNETVVEAKEEIARFNAANSDIKSLQITAGTLARSASAKERNAQNIKVGAYVRNGREKLRDYGDFADVDE